MTAQVQPHFSSGNTIPSSFRSRAFLFTLNEISKYDTLKELLYKLKSMDYYVAAQEKAPTTGHEHIHIFAHFESSYKLNNKIVAVGAHIDCCKCPMKAIEYVKKDGNIIDERGECLHQGTSHTVDDLRAIDNPGDLDWKEYNTWTKIKNTPQKIKRDDWMKNIKVYYIWGPSGIGKSTKAAELCDEYLEEVKHVNDFWTGIVDGTGCCVYDDFRDSHMKASEFINFIDYRVHNLNIKGGSIKNKYNKIIITSIQSPYEIYRSVTEEQREQWIRRIEIIDLSPQVDSI